jgi:hypothetical protein
MNEYVLETSSNIQIPGKPMELRKVTRQKYHHCFLTAGHSWNQRY